MPEVPDTVDDAIEPLTSPSTDEVFEATRPFSAREIASAAASEALSGGGGISLPTAPFSVYFPAAETRTTIAASDSEYLNWVYQSLGGDGGPNYFDLTDPQFPVALADGIYALTVEVQFFGIEADKTCGALLEVDVDGDDQGPGCTGVPLAGPGIYACRFCIPQTTFLAAGMKLGVVAFHNSASSKDAGIFVTVLKLA